METVNQANCNETESLEENGCRQKSLEKTLISNQMFFNVMFSFSKTKEKLVIT